MGKTIFSTFLIFIIPIFTQGQHDNNNNVMYYDDSDFQFPFPYSYGNNVQPEIHTKVEKKNLPETVSEDMSIISVPMITNVLSLFRDGIGFLLSNVPILLFGSIAAFGVCVITPFCNNKVLDMLPKVEDMNLLNPERLKRAAEFVETAIRKFQSLNK